MRALALLALPLITLAGPVAADNQMTPQKAARTPKAAMAINPALAAAVADPRRAADAARDIWRKPAETLSFVQVGPEMKDGETRPGGEGPKGRLVGLYFDPTSGAFGEASQKGIREGAAKYPADVAAASGLPAERFAGMTLEAIPDSEKGTFDRIIVPRMMHNLFRWNIADREIKAMRSLLKDGGMIGIEQHRAKPSAPFSYSDGSKGYLREADVIKFMEVHGFEFVARAEYNANPKDPANHPEGVWELPPNLRTKRDELKANGESGRLTLLFRKRAHSGVPQRPR